jgi:hypothetical protein
MISGRERSCQSPVVGDADAVEGSKDEERWAQKYGVGDESAIGEKVSPYVFPPFL